MAENRVTAEAVEASIVRASVPGAARVTADVTEVALLKNVSPGGNARVTSQLIEVAVTRVVASGARAGDFFFVQS